MGRGDDEGTTTNQPICCPPDPISYLRIHRIWKNRAPRNVLRSPVSASQATCYTAAAAAATTTGATRLVSSMEYVDGDCFSTGTLLLPNVTGTTNG